MLFKIVFLYSCIIVKWKVRFIMFKILFVNNFFLSYYGGIIFMNLKFLFIYRWIFFYEDGI